LTTRRGLAAVLAGASIVLVIISWKGIAVWPFEGDRKQLAKILGPAAGRWLERAEIAAWTPDPNYKAQSYFVVQPMSEADFQAWAADAALQVSQAPKVPAGVFALPAGVKLSSWLVHANDGATGLDGTGTTAAATIWSRWQDGVTYTVVHPTY